MSWEWGSLILAGVALLTMALAIGGYRNMVKDLREKVNAMKTNPTRQDYDQCRNYFCKKLDVISETLTDMDRRRESAKENREIQFGDIMNMLGTLTGEISGLKSQMNDIQRRDIERSNKG